MIGVSARKLSNDRANRDVADHPSLAEYQRRDQADAERLRLIGNVVIALDENDFAGPDLFESHLVDDQQRIFGRIRILQARRALRPARPSSRSSTMLAPLLSNDRRKRLF